MPSDPDEQADTGVMTPARAPSSRPTTAAAPLGMTICTASGDTLRGPPSFIASYISTIFSPPPRPVPITTEKRSGSTSGRPMLSHS